jgi:hypothetical protein
MVSMRARVSGIGTDTAFVLPAESAIADNNEYGSAKNACFRPGQNLVARFLMEE